MAELNGITLFYNERSAEGCRALAEMLAVTLVQLFKKLAGTPVPVAAFPIEKSSEIKTGQHFIFLLSQADMADASVLKRINDTLEKSSDVSLFCMGAGTRPVLNKHVRIYELETNVESIRDFKMEQASAGVLQSLVDITYELSGSLTRKETKNNAITVFVAETTHDQEPARQEIIRELRDFGYNVIPETETGSDYNICKTEVEKMLPSAGLFIHILGGEYGSALKQSSVSKIDLQHQLVNAYLAKQAAGSGELCRYIWIAGAIRHASKELLVFVENMKRDSEQLYMAEIIQNPLEKFKSIVLERLREIGQHNSLMQDQKDKKQSVYHVFEKNDSPMAAPVAASLKEAGYDVVQPDFTHSFNRIDSHWRYLSECDAVLIQYSGNNDAWVSSKLNDIVKAPGYGRSRSFKALGLFLEQNNTFNASGLVKDIMIIRQEKAFVPGLLDPFVKKIG